MTIVDYRRPQNITEEWENIEKELDNISEQLRVFVYYLKESKVWESR